MLLEIYSLFFRSEIFLFFLGQIGSFFSKLGEAVIEHLILSVGRMVVGAIRKWNQSDVRQTVAETSRYH